MFINWADWSWLDALFEKNQKPNKIYNQRGILSESSGGITRTVSISDLVKTINWKNSLQIGVEAGIYIYIPSKLCGKIRLMF